MRCRDFVRHAHPAMQLHRLLTDKARCLTDACLGCRNCAAAFIGILAGISRGGKIGDRTRLLSVNQHLHHAMLQGLETRDGRAELLTLLRVLDRRVIQRIEYADGFGVLDALNHATVEYTKERKQFGTPIARFQALQHRMVEMLIHAEQARSITYLAAARYTSDDSNERSEERRVG